MKHYGIQEDTISERTSSHGVEIDGLNIKDGGFALGSDADGDMYFRSGGRLVRIPKGLPYQMLQMNSGATAPEWATPMPTGSVISYPIGTPPTGFLECDGSSLDRTTYSSLFSIIGTDYGAADGSHFNLPDYRGYFLRGWAHGTTNDPDKAARTSRGDGTGGDVVGSKQTSANSGHTHTINITSGTESANHTHQVTAYYASAEGGNSIYGSNATGNAFYQTTSAESATHTHNVSGTSASSGGNETRPLNINVMYCIKY